VFISEYTNPRMHLFAPSLTHIHRPTVSPLLSLIPHQPFVLPPGAPPAALPPPPALLHGLLPNAEAAYPPAQAQTAGNVSTIQAASQQRFKKAVCSCLLPSVNL